MSKAMKKLDIELSDVSPESTRRIAYSPYSVPATQEQLAALLKKVDVSNSGKYTFEEFWTLMKRLKKEGHWLL